MKKTALTAFGWLVSIVLIALLFAKLDFDSFINGFKHANFAWLALAAGLNMVVIMLKALRIQWLIRPEAKVPFIDLFKVTMIGMAGNNVMPARGGDWLRIYLLGKWQGVSKAAFTSVTGLDKLFDGLAIVVLFGLMSLHSTFPVWVQKGTTIVSVVISVGLFICILLLLHYRRTRNLEATDLGRIALWAQKFGAGMAVLSNKKLVAAAFVNSIAICLLQIVTILFCQKAFGCSLEIWVPALVYVAINLAIVVPSAPSGVGPFEVAAVLAYTWLGLSKVLSLNIALMYHAVQFFPVTIIGLVYYLKSLKRETLHPKDLIDTPVSA